MDRAQVADFYRGKGYQVHESILVTGQSGHQQRVPLLCEGPLGNLAVFFGDAGGIDGHEIGGAKRAARDLGATAVVASASFTPEQRRAAAELGVVLLDAASLLQAPAAPPAAAWPDATPARNLERDLEAHPWPASGRAGGAAAGPGSLAYDIDQVLERFDRGRAPAGAAHATAAAQQAESPPTPPPAAVPLASAPTAPTPVASARSADGGLWRHNARSPAASPARAATAPPASARPFAWLGVPASEAGRGELAHETTVRGRAAPAAAAGHAATPAAPQTSATSQPAVAPLSSAEAQALAIAREERTRRLVRRGAWTLAAGTAVYLFLLWWF